LRVACLADVSVGPGGKAYRDDGEGQDPARGRRPLAPADATACAVALSLRKHVPDTHVEVLALGPPAVAAELEDLLRLGVDRATLLSDRAFAGSDSLVRSRILAGYLREVPFDCILAGTRTADGAAAEVPPMLAELLGLPQVADVDRVDQASLVEGVALVDVDDGRQQVTYRIRLPAVLSLKHHRTQVLPHLRLRDANTDVRDRLQVIDGRQLGLAAAEVGVRGSLTHVVGVLDPAVRQREPLVVRCDDEGIEQVHAFLQRRGLI
jgi:electron transfer flavoprotein beta subunit